METSVDVFNSGLLCNLDVIEQITEMAKNDEEYYVRKEALKLLSKVQNDKEVSRLAAELLLTNTNSCPK